MHFLSCVLRIRMGVQGDARDILSDITRHRKQSGAHHTILLGSGLRIQLSGVELG